MTGHWLSKLVYFKKTLNSYPPKIDPKSVPKLYPPMKTAAQTLLQTKGASGKIFLTEYSMSSGKNGNATHAKEIPSKARPTPFKMRGELLYPKMSILGPKY
jgi:hypothetical protein